MTINGCVIGEKSGSLNHPKGAPNGGKNAKSTESISPTKWKKLQIGKRAFRVQQPILDNAKTASRKRLRKQGKNTRDHARWQHRRPRHSGISTRSCIQGFRGRSGVRSFSCPTAADSPAAALQQPHLANPNMPRSGWSSLGRSRRRGTRWRSKFWHWCALVPLGMGTVQFRGFDHICTWPIFSKK